jgi:hypothetical protein
MLNDSFNKTNEYFSVFWGRHCTEYWAKKKYGLIFLGLAIYCLVFSSQCTSELPECKSLVYTSRDSTQIGMKSTYWHLKSSPMILKCSQSWESLAQWKTKAINKWN